MQVKVVGAVVLVLVGGAGAWIHATFVGSGPVVTEAPSAPRSVAEVPVASAQDPAEAPSSAASAVLSGLVLAGTQVDGKLGSATFLVGGELRPVVVGATLGASSWVLRRVGPASAWVSDGPQGPAHEITVRPPRELAPLMAEGRQDSALPPGLTGKALPSQALVTQRDVQGLAVAEEQQVRVRRRDAQRAGPVGHP